MILDELDLVGQDPGAVRVDLLQDHQPVLLVEALVEQRAEFLHQPL